MSGERGWEGAESHRTKEGNIGFTRRRGSVVNVRQDELDRGQIIRRKHTLEKEHG